MGHTQAKFWKCALQVNPASYISYRGQEQQLSETDYNQQMLEVCLQENIKVLGIANHGNIDGVDAIRDLMNKNDILVFPGFEIASSEKIHFVCLFSEEATSQKLERYLGHLDLLDPEEGVRPSRLSAEQLIAKVNDIGGFIYAAHCTSENGLLKKRLKHIWILLGLKAAQIPGSVEDLKTVEDGFYRKVIRNKEVAYKRELPIAIINAKDIETPETLKDLRASCLIKMTEPSFESFKLAFQDTESRVRLNSDVEEKYYSQIKSLKVTGGYLDGLDIKFSEHLNAVIGGRGTGKTTLLECIRYVLELEPIGINSQKQHKDIIKENLGKSKARVELTIRSSTMNGKTFTIARRYGESCSVKDENDDISSFTPADLMPEIELYGQNEIYEIAQNSVSQRKLLARFLEARPTDNEGKIKETLKLLSENRLKLESALKYIASTEDELYRLPKLEEQVNQFKSLGLEDKLKVIPFLETEKRLLKRTSEEEIGSLEQAFLAIQDVLPDTVFLSDKTLDNLPHSD
ncbi:DNA repair protein, partial [Methylococcaceae bacterium HT5]